MTKTPAPPPVALEDRAKAADARLSSPSAARNKDPVLAVLTRMFPKTGSVLEIGSGTGEHVAHFAKALTGLTWQPSEFDAESRASIAAWIASEDLDNVRPPVALDASANPWPVEDDAPFDAILSMNMIHIAPWEAGLGVLCGAGRLLRPGGVLAFYGPFARGGAHTSPSNAAFDESLKRRNPSWGVRDLDDVVREAGAQGLALDEVVEMPANNLTVVFRRG